MTTHAGCFELALDRSSEEKADGIPSPQHMGWGVPGYWTAAGWQGARPCPQLTPGLDTAVLLPLCIRAEQLSQRPDSL